MQVYDFVENQIVKFLLSGSFDNKKVIKDRLNKRMDDFEKIPFE